MDVFDPPHDCPVYGRASACFVLMVRALADAITERRVRLKADPRVTDVEAALASDRARLWQMISAGPMESPCRQMCAVFPRTNIGVEMGLPAMA